MHWIEFAGSRAYLLSLYFSVALHLGNNSAHNTYERPMKKTNNVV